MDAASAKLEALDVSNGAISLMPGGTGPGASRISTEGVSRSSDGLGSVFSVFCEKAKLMCRHSRHWPESKGWGF